MGVANARFNNLKQTSFAGGTDYGNVSNPAWMNDSTGTLLLRYYSPTVLTSNGARGIFSLGSTSGANNSRCFIAQRYDNTGVGGSSPRYEISTRSNGGTINQLISTSVVPAATYVNVAVRSNVTENALFINGVKDTLLVGLGSPAGNWFNIVSGATKTVGISSLYISGSHAINALGSRIDEVVVVQGVLTDAEILAFHTGAAKNPLRQLWSGSVASYWKFGDLNDTNAITYDRKGTENTTLVGPPSIIAS